MSPDVAIKEADRERIQLIKDTVAKGVTDLELQLFLHACRRTGLDPLMKQIYAVKRWSTRERRELMTIQTGIDGYRLIADRTGKYAGSDDPVFEVTATGKLPTKATATVYKLVEGQRCAFTSSARWEEYVQRNQKGETTDMWVRMPFLMLGKCAEALALRKAFPAELSGIYTTEEMMQAENVHSPLLDASPPQQEEASVPVPAGAPPPAATTLTPVQWMEAIEDLVDDPNRNDILKVVLAEFKVRSCAELPAQHRLDLLKRVVTLCHQQRIPWTPPHA